MIGLSLTVEQYERVYNISKQLNVNMDELIDEIYSWVEDGFYTMDEIINEIENGEFEFENIKVELK